MFNKFFRIGFFKSSFFKISFLIFVFSFFINTNITKADTTIYQKNTDAFVSTPKDNKNY